MNSAVCSVCPHHCTLALGEIGFCGARSNKGGCVSSDSYGYLTSLALDPIEKKPLQHFYPGKKILSVGSYGCNLRCSFCQNYQISMAGRQDVTGTLMTPQELVNLALQTVPQGNIGLAFTYNEPLIGWEFVRDTAALAQEADLQNVLVTNGYAGQEAWRSLLPVIQAMNIDVKAFNQAFYTKIGGDLSVVKENTALAAAACHVEVTMLVIPGENDEPEQIRKLALWLASLDREIPLHLTRFFPRYLMTDRQATAMKTLYDLAEIAGTYLRHVYPQKSEK